jgi:hypothetical protein
MYDTNIQPPVEAEEWYIICNVAGCRLNGWPAQKVVETKVVDKVDPTTVYKLKECGHWVI